MLSPSTHTAFVLPSSSSSSSPWVGASSSSSFSLSSPVAPSFNALYLRPLSMPLQQQQQQLQQHKTRGRPLAFWQRQAEEEVVVRVGGERRKGRRKGGRRDTPS